MTTDVKVYDSIYRVDESADLSDMERAEPKFFANPFGKREVLTPYRGCLIVRYTRTYSNNQTERVTVPYLFGYSSAEKCKGTFCMSTDCPNMAAAKRLIDQVLASGVLRS